MPNKYPSKITITVIMLILCTVLILILARTFNWPDAWIFSLLCFIWLTALIIRMKKYDPELPMTARKKKDVNRNDYEFLEKLEELGYLKYVAPEDKNMVKKELAKSSWPFMVEESKRFYFADAEDLTEGGVEEFLEKLRPFLESQGIQLDKLEEFWGEEDYHISINGKKYLIWSKEEYREETQSNKPGLTWGLSTVRTFSIVNELLERVDSTERLYAVGGGNDLNAVILTRELVDAITQNPDIFLGDKPYIPVNSHPWYGQPHSED